MSNLKLCNTRMLCKIMMTSFLLCFLRFSCCAELFSERPRILVAAWQKNLAKRWQQCRIHGFGWRYGGIENGQCNSSSSEGASLCEGESEFASDFSIGKYLNISPLFFAFSDEICVRKKPCIDYQVISIRDRVDP
jgi:hypothetical protein